jgi:hypothetical protein
MGTTVDREAGQERWEDALDSRTQALAQAREVVTEIHERAIDGTFTGAHRDTLRIAATDALLQLGPGGLLQIDGPGDSHRFGGASRH